MDMNIQKYMAFVKTVEYGSFTKAAEILNYSQSGISRMINDLEKEWKVVLLERGKSGVKLTSDGMKLLPYAKNVCMEYEKLQMEVDELNGLQSGLIRIGTFSSVATHWLPNIIKEFQKTYPGIDYELLLGDYTEIEEWISEGRVDCGFLRLPTCSDFETVFLEGCLPFFRKIMLWCSLKKFLWRLFVMNHLCCWKRGQKQRYRKYLNDVT